MELRSHKKQHDMMYKLDQLEDKDIDISYVDHCSQETHMEMIEHRIYSSCSPQDKESTYNINISK